MKLRYNVILILFLIVFIELMLTQQLYNSALRKIKLNIKIARKLNMLSDNITTKLNNPIDLSITETINEDLFTSIDKSYMKLALRHAQHAYREGEVPIGAVIVNQNGEVLAASRNKVELLRDATAHAEIDCMRKASKLINNWRLTDCTLYSTLEPCTMCLSAMQSFRIKKVIYGTKDIRLGACGSFINLATEYHHPFHTIQISGGLLADESSILLKRFFQNKRIEKQRNIVELYDDKNEQVNNINNNNNIKSNLDNTIKHNDNQIDRGYNN